ncbi:pol protein [Zalerion maritima]|uniref:RNA-directed DNA polymerase n=1 Tax=Zalerion maritima TaxID=339359 RepID=A0AAD5WMT2_9PEZI|nr:pol protein [Zalerion maritima]
MNRPQAQERSSKAETPESANEAQTSPRKRGAERSPPDPPSLKIPLSRTLIAPVPRARYSTNVSPISQGTERTPSPGQSVEAMSSAGQHSPHEMNQYAVVRLPLPLPGTQGSVVFRGDDVSQYTRQLDRMFEQAVPMSDAQKIDYAIQCCISTYAEPVESLATGKTWIEAKEALKTEFADRDTFQEGRNMADLERFAYQNWPTKNISQQRLYIAGWKRRLARYKENHTGYTNNIVLSNAFLNAFDNTSWAQLYSSAGITDDDLCLGTHEELLQKLEAFLDQRKKTMKLFGNKFQQEERGTTARAEEATRNPIDPQFQQANRYDLAKMAQRNQTDPRDLPPALRPRGSDEVPASRSVLPRAIEQDLAEKLSALSVADIHALLNQKIGEEVKLVLDNGRIREDKPQHENHHGHSPDQTYQTGRDHTRGLHYVQAEFPQETSITPLEILEAQALPMSATSFSRRPQYQTKAVRCYWCSGSNHTLYNCLWDAQDRINGVLHGHPFHRTPGWDFERSEYDTWPIETFNDVITEGAPARTAFLRYYKQKKVPEDWYDRVQKAQNTIMGNPWFLKNTPGLINRKDQVPQIRQPQVNLADEVYEIPRNSGVQDNQPLIIVKGKAAAVEEYSWESWEDMEAEIAAEAPIVNVYNETAQSVFSYDQEGIKRGRGRPPKRARVEDEVEAVGEEEGAKGKEKDPGHEEALGAIKEKMERSIQEEEEAPSGSKRKDPLEFTDLVSQKAMEEQLVKIMGRPCGLTIAEVLQVSQPMRITLQEKLAGKTRVEEVINEVIYEGKKPKGYRQVVLNRPNIHQVVGMETRSIDNIPPEELKFTDLIRTQPHQQYERIDFRVLSISLPGGLRAAVLKGGEAVSYPVDVPDPLASVPSAIPFFLYPSPCLSIRIGGPKNRLARAIVDTGAEANILKRTYAQEHGFEAHQARVAFSGYNGQKTNSALVTRQWVHVSSRPERIAQNFFVPEEDREGAPEVILGMPFIVATGWKQRHDKERNALIGELERTWKNTPQYLSPGNRGFQKNAGSPYDSTNRKREASTGLGKPRAGRIEIPAYVMEVLDSDDEEVIAQLSMKEVERLVKKFEEDMPMEGHIDGPQGGENLLNGEIWTGEPDMEVALYQPEGQGRRKPYDYPRNPSYRREAARRRLDVFPGEYYKGNDRELRSDKRRIRDFVVDEILGVGGAQEALPLDDANIINIFTAYKRVADKMKPVDARVGHEAAPVNPDWYEKKWEENKPSEEDRNNAEWSEYVCPRLRKAGCSGTRLTLERRNEILESLGELQGEEQRMFTDMLTNREQALAWSWEHLGKVDPDVAPPQKIDTVPHAGWQVKSIPIPKALTTVVIEMLEERRRKGVIEPSQAAYRNPWFLVKKKDGKYRLINSAERLNSVTTRDAFVPPVADEFAEDVACCQLISLLDFYSGYDQVVLDPESRDLTTFATFAGLFRMTTLPQGGTNSVAQFCRIISIILLGLIPTVCRTLIDDIAVRGPTTTYDGREVYPGVRQYVAEHIRNLDQVLLRNELAGTTISVVKSKWCQKSAVIVGFVCGTNGRSPEQAKVIKIKEWTVFRDASDIRRFIGMVVFYRMFIKDFAHIAKPLYELTRTGAQFIWEEKHTRATEILKQALISPPVLIRIDYSPEAGRIIVGADASGTGWGAWIGQEREGKVLVARYESGCWKGAEGTYHSAKLECKGLLMALKRLRNYLYGAHFTLRMDAANVVYQLNSSTADLPGALVTRWIAWIRQFDFSVEHVSGSKNAVADALSRKPPGPSDEEDNKLEEDIEDFIDAQLYVLRAVQDWRDAEILGGEAWSDESRRTAYFLTTLKRPSDIPHKLFLRWKRKALNYLVRDQKLWRRTSRGKLQPQLVVDDDQTRKHIIQSNHIYGGHKGRNATSSFIAQRYYWKGQWKQVQEALRTCPTCQKRDPQRPEMPLKISDPIPTPFSKVSLDVFWMPPRKGYTCVVQARCDLTGWIEGRPLREATAGQVANFVWQDIICRHGMCGKLVVDGGPENRGFLDKLAKRIGLAKTTVSAYSSRSQGGIEHHHLSTRDALSKLGGSWVDAYPGVLMAQRATINQATGFSPYALLYGQEMVTPIEMALPTWRMINWKGDMPYADFLAERSRAMERKETDLAEAARILRRNREARAKYVDKKNSGKMRKIPLEEGDLVLRWTPVMGVRSTEDKQNPRWTGPYIVHKLSNEGRTVQLREPYEGSPPFERTVGSNRVKKFVQENGWWSEPAGISSDTWKRWEPYLKWNDELGEDCTGLSDEEDGSEGHIGDDVSESLGEDQRRTAISYGSDWEEEDDSAERTTMVLRSRKPRNMEELKNEERESGKVPLLGTTKKVRFQIPIAATEEFGDVPLMEE